MRAVSCLTLLASGLVITLNAAGAEAVPCVGAGGSSVEYAAVQYGSKTYLFARGTATTSGWTVAFKMRPERIFPPQYTLLCTKPTGIVMQVLTPFTEHVAVPGVTAGTTLIVYDGQGKHEVGVWMAIPPDDGR
jgi:hypothetical protein